MTTTRPGPARCRVADGRCTSRRRSASATRSATWPSPTSCAASIRTSRSTGSPSTRSRPCSRRTASGSIPRAPGWPANRPTSPPSRPATTLNAFQAIRRMDEILIANFMVFHDVVEAGEYDLVIGDEAWDVDYYLHENPELKRTAFAWMTDFVGWLPMPAGGDREAFLTADYNAEMIEQVERFPRIRDRAIFVGDPDDIVPDDFGPGLPRDPRLDRAPLRLLRVRDGLRPDAAHRGPRGAPTRARLPRRRAGRHRHGRRVRRRRGPAAAGRRRLSGRAARRSPACA